MIVPCILVHRGKTMEKVYYYSKVDAHGKCVHIKNVRQPIEIG